MYTKLSAVAALVVVAAFVVSGMASAGHTAAHQRATQAAMTRHITSLGYPYTTATCQGKGRRTHGTYAAFRCVANGTVGSMTRSWTVWAKPLRGGWCGSAFSLKTCHRLTAPVYGSEDKCDPDARGSYCSLSSDTAAVLDRYLYGRNPQRGEDENNSCTPSGPNAYYCVTDGPSYTVTWTKASYGWLPRGVTHG
jgi:hypothetical protein